MSLNKFKMLKLNCNWYADMQDASGRQFNSWFGNVILCEDGSLLGIAYDNGSALPTHVLVGFYLEDFGLSVYKMNKSNFHYDPIAFTFFKNINGKENTYYGDFASVTPFRDYRLGDASVIVEETENTSDLYNLITTEVENYEKFVSERDKFQYRIYTNIKNDDANDVINNINYFSTITYKKELPLVFQEENKLIKDTIKNNKNQQSETENNS